MNCETVILCTCLEMSQNFEHLNNVYFQGQGGPDCDFYPTAALDSHVTLESCMNPGCHAGVLPSGQITAPGQTSKQTDASHFKIKYIVSVFSHVVHR